MLNMNNINKNDIIYYARILPGKDGIYDVYELKIHSINIERGYFTAIDSRKKAANSGMTFLFTSKDFDKLFYNREECLELVLKCQTLDKTE